MKISSALQRLAPGPEHGVLAVARALTAAKGGGRQAVEQAAQALGFATGGKNTLQHADGSWIKFSGAKIQGGHQTHAFRGSPVDLLSLPEQSLDAAPAPFRRFKVGSAGSDNAALAANLTRAGFGEVLPNYFARSDGAWFALVGGHIVRGIGAVRYGKLPPGLAKQVRAAEQAGLQSLAPHQLSPDQAAALPVMNPTALHGYLANAQLQLRSGSAADYRQALRAKGFSEPMPGLFLHRDGSWVGFATGGFVSGMGLRRFSAPPQPPYSWATVPPGAREIGSALGSPKVGALTAADFRGPVQALLDAGFLAVTPLLYQHPDSSVVACVDKTIQFAYRRRPLSGAASPDKLPRAALTAPALVRWHRLAAVDPTDVAALRTALPRSGFRETAPDFFVAGKLWVRIVLGKAVAGEAGTVFGTWPSVNALPKRAPTAIHSVYAIAQTGSAKADTLAADLAPQGFKPKAPGFFVHPDGSWVALDGQQLVRGVDGQVLRRVPVPKTGGFPRFATKPPGPWSKWRQQFAIARVPRAEGQFTADELQRCLSHLGFVGTHSGADGNWKHPDGSQVTTLDGRITSSRFQKWGFGDFPYRNGVDGNSWSTTTQQWLNWAQGNRQKAPHDP